MPLRPGDRVRFSLVGRARVAQMPEAWGLHTAASREEIGEVTELWPADRPGEAERVTVVFPSGAAYNWEATCFEPIE